MSVDILDQWNPIKLIVYHIQVVKFDFLVIVSYIHVA